MVDLDLEGRSSADSFILGRQGAFPWEWVHVTQMPINDLLSLFLQKCLLLSFGNERLSNAYTSDQDLIYYTGS
jgi:hypothetical protein